MIFVSNIPVSGFRGSATENPEQEKREPPCFRKLSVLEVPVHSLSSPPPFLPNSIFPAKEVHTTGTLCTWGSEVLPALFWGVTGLNCVKQRVTIKARGPPHFLAFRKGNTVSHWNEKLSPEMWFCSQITFILKEGLRGTLHLVFPYSIDCKSIKKYKRRLCEYQWQIYVIHHYHHYPVTSTWSKSCQFIKNQSNARRKLSRSPKGIKLETCLVTLKWTRGHLFLNANHRVNFWPSEKGFMLPIRITDLRKHSRVVWCCRFHGACGRGWVVHSSALLAPSRRHLPCAGRSVTYFPNRELSLLVRSW